MHSQVLVLDDSLGPLGTNRSHELIHELPSLLELNARPPQTKVEGVLTQALVICSHAVLVSHYPRLRLEAMAGSGGHRHWDPWGNSLKNNGETAHRANATTGDVEVELSNRDTHSTETKVTKTEDTRSVSDDNDLGLVGGIEGGIVLGEDVAERVLVVDVDVETLRSGVDVGVLLASLTDGGGVDNGGKVDEVGLDNREEELGILATGAREETVLEQGSREGVELSAQTQNALLTVGLGASLHHLFSEGCGESQWG